MDNRPLPQQVGYASDLQTNQKTVIPAINEVNSNTNNNTTKIGDFSANSIAESSLAEAIKNDRITMSNKISNGDYVKSYVYADDIGTANTYVLVLNPVATSYSIGITVKFKALNSNTGASTININGLGAKNLYKDVNSALVSGDILAGQIITAIYDGTNFQIIPSYNTQLSGKAVKPTAYALVTNGYFKDPTTGMITQWGESAVTSTGITITLPIAFPTACLNAIATLQNNAQLTGITYNANKLSKSQIQLWSSSTTSYNFDWIAIGY